ncbi:hypothetical protein P8V03_09650 [Clostridium sp. A1-XYC3]|uniref:Uncharacterized protein n=1 Tax=Clostridium tanneri TaxID=3037988 RepID=A0ABU4JTI1_9CLOT|nr:hypothetical protein [Clostridium sp. A1-XYC3]MDW8801417.1 hypothetical protein [Clostridium sp. A1-XYC3]
MNDHLKEIERFLLDHDMKLGKNKTTSNKLLSKLNRKSLISRSMRCVYRVDNFIVKTSSDATGSRLPVGADQCLNEFNIYNSTDKRLEHFREIFCPVYAIYESRFLYLTIHKLLTPLSTKDDSDETIYSFINSGRKFSNESKFFHILENFKSTWVTKSPELQHEYSKISTFGHDENNNLYVLDYGML